MHGLGSLLDPEQHPPHHRKINVPADAYARFMGRYSEPLAVRFAELAQLRAGQRALDVGCGPGALTAQLVERLGADAVSAIDPSAPFVADNAGDGGPLATFWRAVHDIDPDARDESRLAGAREGHLAELCEAAGLKDIEPTSLTVKVGFPTFADWWEPFTLGVGPAGAHVAQLDEAERDVLRSRCERLLPPAPFEIAASAWCVRARA